MSAEFEQRTRGTGHRLTPQRRLVLDAVESLRHGTPDQIHAEIARQGHNVNLSTVYRSLELLDDLGLIRHAHLSDRAPTYHAVSGHEHAHLVCRTCRRTISLTSADLDLSALEAAHDFSVDFGHLTVFGVCGECARASH